MKISNFFKLIIAIVVSELAGIIGAVFTAPAISGWYQGLAKPELAPPNWLFGPVWTTLFIMMGIAAFLVWKKGLDRQDVKIALAIFIGQLILNLFWSIIFFGAHSPGGAVLEIIFLWLAILATIIVFAKISRPAAWLLLPYILWVSFAGYLNYSIWRLNPPASGGQTACTMEAKLCPDGSYVGRTGPKCEFTECPAADTKGGLPIGYTLDSYKVEKVLEKSCTENSECATPEEYLIQSRCPFVSLCLDKKCAVVCPDYVDASRKTKK